MYAAVVRPVAPNGRALKPLADGLSLSDARGDCAHHLSGQGGSSGSVPRCAPLMRRSSAESHEREAPVRRRQVHDSSKLLEIQKARWQIKLLQDPDAPKLSEEVLKKQAELEAAVKAALEAPQAGKP